MNHAETFRDAYVAYVAPTDGLDGVMMAPFQILAAEGQAFAITESHEWHLSELAKLEGDLITPTRHASSTCRRGTSARPPPSGGST